MVNALEHKMATSTKKAKTATCTTRVPACLSPTGQAIEVGEVMEYKRIVFRNGESHIVLANGKQVPDCFFDN